MNKTILITGGAGYVGSHAAYALAQRGYKVIIIDNFSHQQTVSMPWTTVIHADFASEETLNAIFGQHAIDAVMHFAAFIEVGESVVHPKRFYENNVVKTIKLVNTMLAHNVKKIVFSSSCAVYGDPMQVFMREDHPRNPQSPYGKNKLAVEYVLEDYAHAYDLTYVSLRYFNAAGALPEVGLGEQHNPETHVIPLLLKATRLRTPFKVFGSDYSTKDGTCIRDYIHVCDIAEAHVKALQHLDRTQASDVFNLGTGHGYSVKEVIAAVENVCQAKVVVKQLPRRAGDSPILVADASKAKTILGWEPYYSHLSFILQSALRWEARRQKTASGAR